jgi:hypothetical protein
MLLKHTCVHTLTCCKSSVGVCCVGLYLELSMPWHFSTAVTCSLFRLAEQCLSLPLAVTPQSMIIFAPDDYRLYHSCLKRSTRSVTVAHADVPYSSVSTTQCRAAPKQPALQAPISEYTRQRTCKSSSSCTRALFSIVWGTLNMALTAHFSSIPSPYVEHRTLATLPPAFASDCARVFTPAPLYIAAPMAPISPFPLNHHAQHAHARAATAHTT